MKLRYVSGCLLLLTGIIHVASFALFNADTTAVVIVTFFGVVYLIIGGLVLAGRRTGYYMGVIAPVVGLLTAAFGTLSSPAMFSSLMALLMAIDIAVVVMCIVLARRKGYALAAGGS